MRQTILVVGAGIYQVPVITTAKAMGHRVIAVDRDVRAPGLLLADVARGVDVTDITGCISIAREYKVNGVVSICLEAAVETVAAVAAELNLPGISLEAALSATDKYVMREKFAAAGVAGPTFRRARTMDEAWTAAREIGYPLVVKPVDNAGSRGVRRVDNEAALLPAFELALSHSHKRCMILEEFMGGVEVTVESLTFGEETEVLAISDKVHIPFPVCVSICLTYPPALPLERQEQIKQLVKRSIRALGIDNGPTHAEAMVTPQGVKMVEIAARGGGYRIFSDIIPIVSGVNIVQETIKIALGERPDIKPKYTRAAVLRFFNPNVNGALVKVHGLELAKAVDGVIDVVMEVKPGHKMAPITADGERPGYLIAYGETRSIAVQRADMAEEKVRFEVITN